MCYAYSITTNVDALRALVRDLQIGPDIGNFAPLTGVYPDMLAPIVRHNGEAWELSRVRWGMPNPGNLLYKAARERARKIAEKQGRALTNNEFDDLLRREPDRGVHNVRDTTSRHWQPWLAPEFRVVVPFTSFAEFDSTVGPDGKKAGDTWFAFDVERPVAFFAGILAPQWTSVHKVKEGIITTDLFAFLTTEAGPDTAGVNPDSMPVILRTPREIETWMTAPWKDAAQLQRPLPAGSLRIVSVGYKEDPPQSVEPVERDPGLF